MESERSLATVATIESLHPIEGADAILRARVRGWDTVVRLGEVAQGDAVVYFEVDSHLDTSQERFAFLAPMGLRTNEDGFTGHVVKTVRLRGQFSQGFALPLAQFPEADGFLEGDDVTEALGIIKWDPKLPDELGGTARGFLPSYVPRTSEVRIQNDAHILADSGISDWVATEKLDGESMTIWTDGADDYGVSGRTIDLVEDDNNVKWKLAKTTDLLRQLRNFTDAGHRVVIQGEAYGLGIKKNPLRLDAPRFSVFSFYIDGVEMPRSVWPGWLRMYATPIHALPFPTNSDQALLQVEGLMSRVNFTRKAEGIVWRSLTQTEIVFSDGRVQRASVKVVSNSYAMKNDN
jgi:RNA ligase (TIGR02306 family)